IDGTANFVRGLRCSAISVALAQDGELIAGIVYHPYIDEIFYAEKGKGAFRDGQPIRVSDRAMQDGFYYFGTGSYYNWTFDRTFALARVLFDRMLDLRRFGPAAYEFCNVACGRLELGFESLLQPWDYAAAACILSEAGGRMTQLDGSPITLDRPCSILAGNAVCHREFFEYGMDKL
ncbi:MAG: inositol monophosphatase, partial [Butyricicoccus sp.]|nr:inositol monophosphatase [Butyricicoccus sp.]